MTTDMARDRPVGVYFVTLYFVLTGFLESIQKYREWGYVHWSPLDEHSFWHLLANASIYFALAYLVWSLTWFGRLAALVFGYLYLAMCVVFVLLYFSGTPMNSAPLFFVLVPFHVIALPILLYYLQTEPRKALFQVSMWELLLPDR
jgi:hypothetical protein